MRAPRRPRQRPLGGPRREAPAFLLFGHRRERRRLPVAAPGRRPPVVARHRDAGRLNEFGAPRGPRGPGGTSRAAPREAPSAAPNRMHAGPSLGWADPSFQMGGPILPDGCPVTSAAAPGSVQDARTRPVTNHTAPVDAGSCAAVETAGEIHANDASGQLVSSARARGAPQRGHAPHITSNTGGPASGAGIAG